MYCVNASVFQSPLTATAFYWLGFLAGDGSISSGKYPQIVLKLRKSDSEHVASLARFMKFNGPVKETDRGRSFRVKLPGRELAPILATFGITPQKTWTLRVKDELASNVHFWRGFSDADGSIFWRTDKRWPTAKPRPGFSLSKGSQEILKQAIDYISRTLGIVGRLRLDRTLWMAEWSDDNATQVVGHLYACGEPALPRKLTRANAMMGRLL